MALPDSMALPFWAAASPRKNTKTANLNILKAKENDKLDFIQNSKTPPAPLSLPTQPNPPNYNSDALPFWVEQLNRTNIKKPFFLLLVSAQLTEKVFWRRDFSALRLRLPAQLLYIFRMFAPEGGRRKEPRGTGRRSGSCVLLGGPSILVTIFQPLNNCLRPSSYSLHISVINKSKLMQ